MIFKRNGKPFSVLFACILYIACILFDTSKPKGAFASSSQANRWMKWQKGLIEKVCKKFIILIKIQQQRHKNSQYPDLFENKTFASILGAELIAKRKRALTFDKEPEDTSRSH